MIKQKRTDFLTGFIEKFLQSYNNMSNDDIKTHSEYTQGFIVGTLNVLLMYEQINVEEANFAYSVICKKLGLENKYVKKDLANLN